MKRLVWLALCATTVGCAAGSPTTPQDAGRRDAGPRADAGTVPGFDAGPDDADGGPDDADGGPDDDAGAAEDAGGPDGGPMDAGPTDAGGLDAGVDAGTDAGAAGPTCPALDPGDTLALDGSGDLAKYASSQILSVGGTVGSADEYGITWDQDYLYVTLESPVFADGFRPVHVYLEARASLAAPAHSMGKQYDGLTPRLPFDATHLIAVRPTSVADGIAYNGVYTPGASWTTFERELIDGVDVWAGGTSALSVRVPWAALGVCPTTLRMTAHVVNGMIAANEWKDFIPLGAQPWGGMSGGDPGEHFEIDLTADPAVSGWTVR